MILPLRRLSMAALLLAALLAPGLVRAAESPRVVASIKPVHSLVAGVMQGVGEPALIVRGAASPHTYALRPADAQALARADLVFWIGEELESFLAKPLSALGGKARAVALLDQPGMSLLPARTGGAWDAHDDHDGHAHGDADTGDHAQVNPHLWLDPGNARRIVEIAAAELSARDSSHAATYAANARAVIERLDRLDAELRQLTAPVAARPFVVFHDAYAYFEARYGLNAVGAITVSPERRPSARRLSEIRARIRQLGAACVFAEPQFEPALVRTIVEDTPARRGTLDPEGADLPDGPDLYFRLLRNLADSLAGCLARG